MTKEIKNYGRSVKARLLTLSKESGIPYMTILVRYIQERLLYRVAQSEYRANFFLKGGALLYAFNQEKARPTKDIDFLGIHININGEYIKSVFAQIAAVPCEEDGILVHHTWIIIRCLRKAFILTRTELPVGEVS